MRSTILLRLALAGLGFALGLGVALAVRWTPPPDLAKPTCPDCRGVSVTRVPYTFNPDDPTKVVGPMAGTFDADPSYPTPTPLNGPRFHCPRCQAMWGPPAFHKKGHRVARY